MPRPVTPPVAADAIIELLDQPGHPIVLVERRHEPLGWALPGGFVDVGETVEQAAIREAREETGLDIELGPLLGVFSDPARDPRGHTIAVVFVASAHGKPAAGDDARSVVSADPRHPPPLAFDHARVLADYVKRFRQSG